VAVLVDIAPLRHSRAFARLWGSGLAVSVTAQMVQVALSWGLYENTGSSLAVGTLGLAIGIPTLVFSLLGGVLTDVRRPRQIATVGVLAQGAVTVGFLVCAAAGVLVPWAVYVLAAAQALAGAVTAPTRRPYLRALLTPALIPAASVLYLMSMHAGQIAGPLIGGLLVSSHALVAVFALHLIMLCFYLISVRSLPDLPPASAAALGVRAALDGIRTAARLPAVRGALVLDLAMTFLGLPMALLPAYNVEVLHGDASDYGLLVTLVSVGGVAATVLSGRVSSSRRPGRLLVLFTFAWTCCVLLLGLTSVLLVAGLALVLMGAFDVFCLACQQTIVQLDTPDPYLGRIGSLQNLVGMGGPQLGNFRAGLFGAWWGPAPAILIGALTTATVVTVIAGTHRSLAAFRVPEKSTDR